MALQLGGQGRRGRPRCDGWMDGVNDNDVSLGIRNWKIITMDQDRWKSALEEVQIHKWVVAP